MEAIPEMPFLTFSNANIQFAKKKLTSRTYIIKNALLIIYWVEFIDKKKFAKTALDKNIEAFVVHVASLTSKMRIYSA